MQLLNKTDNVNIFISILCVLSFSTLPNPSESIIINFFPFAKEIGRPQTHSPLVQALIVEPILKPDILSMIKLAKNDFPLL